MFILVSRDLKVEFVKEEDNQILKDAIGGEIYTGEDPTILIQKESAAYFIERLKEGLSGRCFSFSVELADIDQGRKKVEVLLTPNYGKDRSILGLGIILIFRDDFLNKSESSSNELKVVDQDPEGSELKYKFLFENNPAPMFIWDRDTTQIIATNERCEKLYGYTREEFLQLTIFDIRPEEDHERLIGIAKEESKFSNFGKGAFKGLSTHIKKTGEPMDVEINAQAINYEGIRASLVLVHDVTQKVLTSTIEKLEFDLMEEAIQEEIELKVLLEKFLLGIENSVSGIRTSLMHIHKGKFLNFSSPQFTKELIAYIEGMTIGPDEPCIGRAAFTGQRVFSLEIPHDHYWQAYKDATSGQGFKSCYSIPIINSDKAVIATFTVYFLEQKEYEKEDFERHQRIASLISLILDNHFKKEEVKLSNERFEYVNLATRDALYDWDILKDKLYWGKSYERLLGRHVTPNGSEVKNWENLIHPEDRSRVLEILNQDLANSQKESFHVEYQFRINDGNYLHVVDRAIFIRDTSGKAVRMIGALSDVTQQRLEETRLKLLESVVTHTNDAIMITEAAPISLPGPRIVYVNEAFTRMTGYAEEEVLGKSPRILQGPNSDKEELKRLKEALESWQPCEITTINYKKNGEEFWTNFSISPVADASGWFTHWISIQREVTAQKIEEQKRELLAQVIQAFGEEKRFNFALDRSLEKLVKFKELDAGEIWLVNSDKTKLNLVSRYALSDAGSKFFSMVDKKSSFRHGEGLPGQIWERNEILSVDDLTESAEFTRRQAMLASGMNGVFGFPLHFSAQVIGVAVFTTQNKGGFVRSQLNVFNSLSQVLGAEIYRKKMEDELSQIFDTAQDIICILGFDGKFKKINRGASYLLGYSEEELLSGSFMDFVHPEDWIETENVLDHLCQGQNFMHFFNRLITKEGEVVWLDWNSSVIIDEELVYSVAKDITEEKELQSLLDSANKMARIGFWEVDVASGIQYWSPVTKEIHEVEDTYVANVEHGIDFYAPEAKPIIIESFNRCIQTGEPYDHELQIISAKGNKIWIRTQGQAEFQNGVCKRVYGSIQDVTNLKLTQIHLKETLDEKDQILESIGDGFFSLDKNWTVTYWNHAAEKLLKQPKEMVLGHNLKNVFPKQFALNSYRNYKEALEQNKQLVFEDYRSDLETWFEVSVFPSLIGSSVYFKDITLRKTTEELIRQSNERFEKVAEATHEAIWDWDIVQNKVYWGPGYKTLFGLDIERPEITYGSWEAQIHEADLDLVKRTVNSALEDKSIANFQNDYRFRRADGTYANVIDRAVIIRDRKGAPIRMVGAIQDITDQKKYEISLRNLNDKLEVRARELAASNSELEQFAYVASHDLQEPLRMVTSFLTQLELKYEKQLDERAKKYIYYAVDGAKRMRQIILDLLEFSRIGRMEGEKETIDMEEIVAEVFKLQFNLIQTKNAKITWSDLPVIRGYRTQLLQIFQNLISNAMKYSKEGVQPEVHIFCRDLGETWEFSIKDNGIGIDEESFDKIFIIFQRLHAKDQFTGSGIGLAIVKKIVENYGGRIWVDSVLGLGSTFRFTLRK